MADEVDSGNELAQHSLNCSIANIVQKVHSTKPSLEFCIDCDNEIPLARRQAIKGCERCAECQSKQERIRKHFA